MRLTDCRQVSFSLFLPAVCFLLAGCSSLKQSPPAAPRARQTAKQLDSAGSGNVTLAWDWAGSVQEQNEVVFLVIGSSTLQTKMRGWPVLAIVPATARSATFPAYPAAGFFTVICSNTVSGLKSTYP